MGINRTMPRLSDATLRTESDHLAITLEINANEAIVEGPLQVQLVQHDDIDVFWWASTSCAQLDGYYECRIGLDPANLPRLLQLAHIEDSAGTQIELVNNFLFLESSDDGEWTSNEAAEAERKRLEQARSSRYDVSIVDPNATATDPFFAVLMLVDNLLLTTNQRVPGIRIFPLSNTNLGADVAMLLNATLLQLGFDGAVDLSSWLDKMRSRRPSVAIFAPKVQAAFPQKAVDLCRQSVHQLLDLMALRRGSKPRLLGGAVGHLDPNGQPRCAGFWIEGSDYRGNLLGGFLSGENQHGLLLHWSNMVKDPRVRLWLSLYADAIGEDRWDYVIFRCFNLLEGIGKELLPPKKVVCNQNGVPYLQQGKNPSPYTTKEARGKVYALIQLVSARMNQSSNGNLWDEVGIWTEVRNEVAHRGTWKLPDGETPTSKQATVELQISQLGYDGTFELGVDAMIRGIREAVKSTLYAGLRGLL
jgi:hypothetical protein